jgi:hypothetical protein
MKQKDSGKARIHFADREKPDPTFSLHIKFLKFNGQNN